MGNQHGHPGGAIGCQLAAGIETEPTDPQHGGTDDGHGDIVRLQGRASIALALADHDTGHQASNPGVDVNDRASRKIHHVPVPEQGSVTRPGHVADGKIGEQGPDDAE